MAEVALADLIDQVAAQLIAAEQRAAKRQRGVLQFEECELEMAFSVSTSGKGGLRVWIFELGGDRSKSNSNTIRVKFSRPANFSGVFVTTEEALAEQGQFLSPKQLEARRRKAKS